MAAISLETSVERRTFPVLECDLAATLNSGQAFRWQQSGIGWEGAIGRRWVHLRQDGEGIHASVAEPAGDWAWLVDYLQLDCQLDEVISTFPEDEPMRRAVSECRGLRLLRQDVWECLASFILSSTKQILQIRQIIGRLCGRFGEPLTIPPERPGMWGFPSADTLAKVSERELRKLGMGFRAPYLSETAVRVARREIDLERLKTMSLAAARAELMRLPGVGRKIADCVLLFGVGHAAAFPVDVWVLRTLRELYLEGRAVPLRQVVEFADAYFGPYAGYAQQYLFHSARLRAGKLAAP